MSLPNIRPSIMGAGRPPLGRTACRLIEVQAKRVARMVRAIVTAPRSVAVVIVTMMIPIVVTMGTARAIVPVPADTEREAQ
jgi:hypothetical protein